ncbi:MAG: hypothetical protein KAT29_07530 [Anaerolineales bacterium]|nr:hypothetical protein [Anaerolineales bacterium]
MINFATQTFALGQRGHHLQAVAENHAVGPLAIVLVEFGLGSFTQQTVEI